MGLVGEVDSSIFFLSASSLYRMGTSTENGVSLTLDLASKLTLLHTGLVFFLDLAVVVEMIIEQYLQ